jgi:hypothetical protein
MTPKVFCIGFHKTGTKSMKAALTVLGYRVTGPDGVYDPQIATNVSAMAARLGDEFDAFQDNPWPLLYREMDARYPGSRFVLTVRDPEAWIRSQVAHFGTGVTPMRQWIYGSDHGCPAGNEDVYLARYARHNAEVRTYFAARPNDLVEMDLEKGDGWEPLCRLLGRPVPAVPFPHKNRAEDRRPRPAPRETPRAPDAARGALATVRRLLGFRA